MRFALIAPAAVLLLAACAGTPREDGGYSGELARLNADCVARGGILTTSGEATGRVAIDNICVIRGQPARAGR